MIDVIPGSLLASFLRDFVAHTYSNTDTSKFSREMPGANDWMVYRDVFASTLILKTTDHFVQIGQLVDKLKASLPVNIKDAIDIKVITSSQDKLKFRIIIGVKDQISDTDLLSPVYPQPASSDTPPTRALCAPMHKAQTDDSWSKSAEKMQAWIEHQSKYPTDALPAVSSSGGPHELRPSFVAHLESEMIGKFGTCPISKDRAGGKASLYHLSDNTSLIVQEGGGTSMKLRMSTDDFRDLLGTQPSETNKGPAQSKGFSLKFW